MLLRLDEDVWLRILSFLNEKEVSALQEVCKCTYAQSFTDLMHIRDFVRQILKGNARTLYFTVCYAIIFRSCIHRRQKRVLQFILFLCKDVAYDPQRCRQVCDVCMYLNRTFLKPKSMCLETMLTRSFLR